MVAVKTTIDKFGRRKNSVTRNYVDHRFNVFFQDLRKSMRNINELHNIAMKWHVREQIMKLKVEIHTYIKNQNEQMRTYINERIVKVKNSSEKN